MTTTEAQNKAFVLEAFDMLFNKRDYAGAERFWSPAYIQHSAHIAPGREGLFELVKAAPKELHYENALIVASSFPHRPERPPARPGHLCIAPRTSNRHWQRGCRPRSRRGAGGGERQGRRPRRGAAFQLRLEGADGYFGRRPFRPAP